MKRAKAKSQPSQPSPDITPLTTDLQIAEDTTFATLLNTDDGSYREEQAFGKKELPFGKTLYARVRHSSKEYGYSKWSEPVSFHIEVPSIVGVAIDTSRSPASVTYIDYNGNVHPNPDILSHPTIRHISMVEMDSDRAPVTMTKFPKFYIKTAMSGPIGTYSEGKICYWLSNLAVDGFRVHPAFKKTNTKQDDGKYITNDFVYIGTYVGHQDTINETKVLGSKKGATVATGAEEFAREKLLAACEARNDADAGQSGWHSYDIWDVAMLRFLGMMVAGQLDLQYYVGSNYYESPVTGSTNCKIVFKGTMATPEVWIDDLWSTYWHHVDGVTIDNAVLTISTPSHQGTIVPEGGSAAVTMPNYSGFIQSFLTGGFTLGDDDKHDLLELFLPGTLTSSEYGGIVSDYYNYNTDTKYMKVGGHWASAGQGGLFAVHSFADSYDETYQSWEIIRYDPSYYGKWVEDRRCGYIYSSQRNYAGTHYHYIGTTEGSYSEINDGTTAVPNNCPLKCGPGSYDTGGGYTFTESYESPCLPSNWLYFSHIRDWMNEHSCPKGWGKNKDLYPDDDEVVLAAQGWVRDEKVPVYGYVERQRTVWYNYVAGRITKW